MGKLNIVLFVTIEVKRICAKSAWKFTGISTPSIKRSKSDEAIQLGVGCGRTEHGWRKVVLHVKKKKLLYAQTYAPGVNP